MKNSKLLIAFAAGVAVALLLTGKSFPFLPVPSLRVPDLDGIFDGGIRGTIGLLALILVAAYLSRSSGTSPTEATPGPKTTTANFFEFLKTLRTSETDRWLGGVCGGLGQNTPIPSWIWRLGFAAAFLYYGSGLLAYVLLWIFVPDSAKSPDAQPAPNAATPGGNFLEFLRHLKRSRTDSWFGGVCGGLATWTSFPAWLWRLGFAVLFFCFGTGFLLYVLLWIFIPSDHTKEQVAA